MKKMKKMILAASLLLLLFIVPPVSAVDEHHQGNEIATSPATQVETEKIDASLQKMHEMREKIEAEKNPTARKELMHQHMQMMKDGMNMMATKGGQEMMMDQKDTSSMTMADRVAMMEKKLTMMEKMMGQSGGMMMGDASVNPMNDRMNMMEKKMVMLQEMINGLIMQQELMLK